MNLQDYETDLFTGGKSYRITYLGHGTLYINSDGREIHIDPVSDYADYSGFPQADLILITHHHGDHLDGSALKLLMGEKTRLIMSKTAAREYGSGEVLGYGEKIDTGFEAIEAVPAYNTTAGRDKFHPKGRDNGYILTLGDPGEGQRIYIAGDTEVIPEMHDFLDIAIAFLPMNQPYTMTPPQVADAARIINPRILIPYHYGETDTEELIRLLEDWPGEVRIRPLA